MDEARHLATMPRVFEVETMADLLKVELVGALEGQRGAGTIERRPPRCKFKPPVTRKVRSLGQLMRHTFRATTLTSTCASLSCRGGIPKIGEATGPLIFRNTTPEEIVSFVRQRQEILSKALGLEDIVLPPRHYLRNE